MSDIPVIDPTMTPAWDTLDQLADNFDPDLRKLFADDPNRTQTFTSMLPTCTVDLSKNLRVPHAWWATSSPSLSRPVSWSCVTACTRASTSTSPRTAPSCTPRCAVPRPTP